MDPKDALQQYLDGDLSPEDVRAFEAEMARDEALAERVRLHRRLDAALGNAGEISLEAQLRAIMDAGEAAPPSEEPAPAPPKGKSRRLWLYISGAVAAVALLLIVFRVAFPPQDPVEPKQLYTEYYRPYDGSNEIRSDEKVPTSMLDAAFDPYLEGDYVVAGTAFQAILDSFPDNARAHFYRGICHLESGAPDQATVSFRRVIADGKNLFLTQAHWYLALTCLRQTDRPCAQAELKTLQEGTGLYKDLAEEILEKL